MRLAVDTTALHDARTGIGVVTHELLRELAARPGLEVIAFSVSWRGRDAAAGFLPPGVRFARRPMAARPLRAAWRLTSWPPIEWWTGSVDAVLGTNFVVPPAGAARIAVVHDLTAWRFPELCTADTLRYPGLVGRAIETGAHVVTPSAFVTAEVVARLGAPPAAVHTVPWAASHAGTGTGGAPAGRAAAGGARYVLSLGTIEPRKDLATLVRAFDEVAAGDPDVRLVVAGPDGWGVEQYRAAVAAARHRDRIVRLGYVDDATRADLLAGAAAFAYPSVYEGFGLPPLEALAAGIPVVATAAGALPEVLGDAADLVPPGDAGALAAALAAALALGEADRRRRADIGRARAAARTWADAAGDIVAVVTEAVAERRTIPAP